MMALRLVIVAVASFTSLYADTIFDGATKRYGCIAAINGRGVLLDGGCDGKHVNLYDWSGVRYLEFNDERSGFTLAAKLQHECAPCACATPELYYMVLFTKGAGTVWASKVDLLNGTFRLWDARHGKQYRGPVGKIFAVKKYFECATKVPDQEVPSTFEEDSGR